MAVPQSVLVEVRSVSKRFNPRGQILPFARKRQSIVKALDDVSLEIMRGEVFGIAGESGSGKTTLAEIIVRLNSPTTGRVVVDGQDVGAFGRRALKAFRREAQIVFQNPYDAHNPRFTVRETIEEPLVIHGMSATERRTMVERALQQVGLEPPMRYLDKPIHQLSGGERQRVSIARALTLAPKLLIADEPTSMLDVSVRAGVLNLLRKLNRTEALTVIIISHDLCSLASVCDRIAVMRYGMIVELGTTASIIDAPMHSYTRALLAAVPDFDLETYGDTARREDDAAAFAEDDAMMTDRDNDNTKLVELSEGHFVRQKIS